MTSSQWMLVKNLISKAPGCYPEDPTWVAFVGREFSGGLKSGKRTFQLSRTASWEEAKAAIKEMLRTWGVLPEMVSFEPEREIPLLRFEGCLLCPVDNNRELVEFFFDGWMLAYEKRARKEVRDGNS